MTDTDKIKILRHIKSKKRITRHELCSYLKTLKSDCDLSMLQDDNDMYVKLVSDLIWDSGRVVNSESDVFALSDYGRDILHRHFIDNARTIYPYVISTLAFVVSVIALIKSFYK